MRGTLPVFGEIIIEGKNITYLAQVHPCMKTVVGNDGPVRSIQRQKSSLIDPPTTNVLTETVQDRC